MHLPTARRAAGAVSVMLAATLAGCSGGAPVRPPRPVSSPVSAPPATAPGRAGSMKAQVLAAYTGMWRAYAAAARTAAYQSPALSQYAAGEALMALIHSLYLDHQRHVVARGGPVLHPRVVSLALAASPAQASVSDCADDSHWLTYHTSGTPAGGAVAGRHRVMALLRLFGAQWKVTYFVAQKAGTC
jgi:hypothetical protein